MYVKLISQNDGAAVCARAAAVCSRSKNPMRALQIAMESGHESVLEHAVYTFEVDDVSRALLAQVTRHRLASFSVQSQRYVSLEELFDYVTPPRIAALGEDAVTLYENQMKTMHGWYNEWVRMLGGGQDAQEDARFVLPNATVTTYLMTMNARELRHFFSLRCCNRAQWEIRELAEEMYKQCLLADPELFSDAGPGCVRGHCPESRPCGNPKGGKDA